MHGNPRRNSPGILLAARERAQYGSCGRTHQRPRQLQNPGLPAGRTAQAASSQNGSRPTRPTSADRSFRLPQLSGGGQFWDEISDLTAERVSLSLSEGLVPDSPDSLEALNAFNDVNLTIAFLKESQLDPDLLPAASFAELPVDALLSADEIAPEIRAEIVSWVENGLFDAGLKASDMFQVLTFTNAEGIPLDAQFLLRIAQFPLEGVDRKEVERHLVRAVTRLSSEQRDGEYLSSFLQALGGDFGALLEPTGSWRDFENFDDLTQFLLEVQNHVPSVYRVIDRGENTIRVTRRKQ